MIITDARLYHAGDADGLEADGKYLYLLAQISTWLGKYSQRRQL